MNDIVHYKRLPTDQKLAILKLLPKPLKDLLEIRNWRPISLLNSDYKIYAKILANRLQPFLEKIISPQQSAYIKGRSIMNNTKTICDVIAYTDKKKISGLLACIDFEKAFDSLDHRALKDILKQFGFTIKFIEMIEIVFKDIKTQILLNGNLLDTFSVKNDIRQGCHVSVLLFIIVQEFYKLLIEQSKIQGL